MERLETSVEIERPVRKVYDQFTEFEEFPRFMKGIREVQQLDLRTLHFKASIGGKIEEWDAEIVDQLPDQQIAWRATRGAVNRGVMTFTPLDGRRCRLRLVLEYDPKGLLEKAGDAMGLFSRRVIGDLQRFKRFVEQGEEASGGYRGEIRPVGPSREGPVAPTSSD